MPTHIVAPYQKQGVQQLEAWGIRGILADDMGLGKTLQALHLIRRNPAPTTVVCPASVKGHWAAEANAQIGMRATVLEGQTPPAYHKDLGPLVVVNYDIFPYWVEYLKRHRRSRIIIDESQYITNRDALRTKAVTEYSRQCSQAVALSGTPLTNKPAELWPTLNIVRPDLFPSFWSYAQEFCRPRLLRGRWTFGGARNVPKLHKILVENCMVRRLKKDVLQELPAIVRYVVPMELSRPSEYAQARDRFLKWLITSGAGSVVSARKNERLTQMGYLKQLAAQLKCRAVVEWVNNYLATTDEKLLLFAVHHKMMSALQRLCNAKSVLIHGGVTGADRKAAIAQFRGDANTRLCIAQIVAVGTGTDGLQAAAQSCAFAELDWRPGIHTQAEARLDRIGQKGSVTSHWLIALGTIEEQLCSVIEKKQSIISGVLDGGPLESDLDVFSQIEQLMLGQTNAHQNQ